MRDYDIAAACGYILLRTRVKRLSLEVHVVSFGHKKERQSANERVGVGLLLPHLPLLVLLLMVFDLLSHNL